MFLNQIPYLILLTSSNTILNFSKTWQYYFSLKLLFSKIPSSIKIYFCPNNWFSHLFRTKLNFYLSKLGYQFYHNQYISINFSKYLFQLKVLQRCLLPFHSPFLFFLFFPFLTFGIFQAMYLTYLFCFIRFR